MRMRFYLAVLLVGCSQSTIPPDGGPPVDTAPPPSDAPPTDGTVSTCTIPPTLMGALTEDEWTTIVTELLGVDPAGVTLPRWDRNQHPTHAAVVAPDAGRLHDAAVELVALSDLTALSARYAGGCDPLEVACGARLVDAFAERAQRRGTPALAARHGVVFSAAAGDGETRLRASLAAVLISPYVIFIPEVGDGMPADDDGRVALSSWEVATRLALLLWGSSPDDELRSAAEAGELSSAERVDAQARRMLADPRARVGVADAVTAWLQLPPFGVRVVSDEVYASMREETRRFATAAILEDGGDFTTLVAGDYTFMDDVLATHYGRTPPAEPGWVRVDVSPESRLSLLSHGSILTHEPTPTTRGRFLLERLLCYAVPSPPPGVAVEPPVSTPGLSRREQMVAATSDPICAGCHTLIDPLGFAFEDFDPTGRYVPAPDTTGTFPEATGVSGAFDDGAGLAATLAASDVARTCHAQQWLMHAQRNGEGVDPCQLEEVARGFIEAGDVRELIISVARVGLRHRSAVGLAPDPAPIAETPESSLGVLALEARELIASLTSTEDADALERYVDQLRTLEP